MTIDIDKLETLAKAAGGESWSTECGPDGTFDGMHVWGPDGDSVCRVFGNIGNWPEPIDESQIAAHIEANSPKAILELCAEMRRLREDLQAAKLLAHANAEMFKAEKVDGDRYRWLRATGCGTDELARRADVYNGNYDDELDVEIDKRIEEEKP
jgi:hypothetical protein